MDIFWQSFFSFLEKIGPIIIPLFAIYLGWKLGQRNLIKQLQLDALKQKFDALREIKSVIENIPPNLNEQTLIERLRNDPKFCKSLTSRLVRLLGIRREFIPFLESEFINLIDFKFRPLFIIENGTFTFREEKIQELVGFTKEVKILIENIEEKLTKEYKNQTN